MYCHHGVEGSFFRTTSSAHARRVASFLRRALGGGYQKNALHFLVSIQGPVGVCMELVDMGHTGI